MAGLRRAGRYFRAALGVVWWETKAKAHLVRYKAQERATSLIAWWGAALSTGQGHLRNAGRSAVRRLKALPSRRLLVIVIAIDIGLALALLIGLWLVVVNRQAYGLGQADFGPLTAPKLLTHLSPRVAHAQPLLLPATPTRSPTPTSSPTPTEFPPVITVTPLPIDFSVWPPSLPRNGGWNGPGACPLGDSVFAPMGSGAFVWPTDDHFLAGRNFSLRWHPGLDISAPLGAPLYAADSGVVVYAGWNNWGYGNLVILNHGNGWHTLYAHQSQINVACGQAIKQGQVIGWAGSTGRSTAPHLHFEMRFDGGWVNPWSYLP
jgi:hypothetical protein